MADKHKTFWFVRVGSYTFEKVECLQTEAASGTKRWFVPSLNETGYEGQELFENVENAWAALQADVQERKRKLDEFYRNAHRDLREHAEPW